MPPDTACSYSKSEPRVAGAVCRTRRSAGEEFTGCAGGVGWRADLPKARRYQSGCQGTYSWTSPLSLDCLAKSRNTESTSSFWSSSLAVVFVPSHSDSIQRTVLVLAPVVSPSVFLTPLPPVRSHQRVSYPLHQPSSPSVSMHVIRHVACAPRAAQDMGVSRAPHRPP